ncbi:MAG: PBP1A family penicillin-binding protein [Herbinix sp.]|nr:PBP1A family penicillin-binding protein [Herbinix sp.]
MPKGRNEKHKKGKSKIGRKIKLTLQFLLLFTLLTILGAIIYFYLNYGKTILQMQSQAKQVVDTSTEDTFKSSQTSLVYDSEGNMISELKSEKDVYYIQYEDIPTAAIDAMVVTEDRNFFEHDGVDYLANVRAAIALIKHKGEITQGASTITQQLVKNVFLTQEVTYTRKIKEIFIAQEMEKIYTKNQIMEFYLNEIYFANGHYGLQAAAQAYFGKGVSSLSLSQIAFLCAIPNNPSLYNPLTKMDNTLKRRDRILKQMYDNGKINQSDYEKALDETIELSQNKSDKQNYVETYAYNCAIRALMKQKGFEFRYQFDSEEDKEAYDKSYEELYSSFQKDLYTNGYRIYTSIDLEKQKLLQQVVDDTLSKFTEKDDEGVYKMQGAAVCIDNDTGRVVSIVGGREQDLGGYTLNRAFQSYRQPGSSIKPLIVYTPAFERSYTPASIVWDTYSKDGPKNSDGKYLGKIKLQKALEASKNVIAWKIFKDLTPKGGLSYLLRMNFAKISEKDYTLASSLGGLTNGASPIEMAAAYATLENNGYYREPSCIVKIMDSEGNEIVSDTIDTKEVYETNATKIMTEALTGVIKNGTAKGLGLTNTISAGKTGTTNDKKDGWFVGYTPYYTTSVWVGYDIPKSVSDLMGSTYPGTIWHDFMEQLHTSSMNKKFEYYDWRADLKAQKEEEEAQNTVTPTQAPMVTSIQEDNTVAEDTVETPIGTVTPLPDETTGDDSDAGTIDGDTTEDTFTEDGTVPEDITDSETTDNSNSTGDITDNGTVDDGTTE